MNIDYKSLAWKTAIGVIVGLLIPNVYAHLYSQYLGAQLHGDPGIQLEFIFASRPYQYMSVFLPIALGTVFGLWRDDTSLTTKPLATHST